MENLSDITESINSEDLFNDEKVEALNSCFKTKIFIVGYPCEMGARNMNARAGCDRAPDTFRELLKSYAYP